ncbi:MAG: helix-turn-helix transcriptional regulator [Christensenellaceae bacterium]|nr:helix-turn-helix transcriptional regulator [Christensenellaceae bacterium]
MLTASDLRDFRQNRGLSLRDVSAGITLCGNEMSAMYISYIENGQRHLSKETHDIIVAGINRAYFAVQDGTLTKGTEKKRDYAHKEKPEQPETEKPTEDVKPSTAKKQKRNK